MRGSIPGILWFFLSVAIAAQTPTEQSAPPAAQDGGVRAVLASIVIPPIPNQPFSATLETEWIQYSGEGGTITLVNERPIVRDSKGRIYQERWALVPKYSKVKSQRVVIQIADPKQHTLYSCAPYQHICELETYDPTHELAAAEPRKPIPNGTVVQDHLTVEDLGTRRIAGVDTIGRRETNTIDVGVMGNDPTTHRHRRDLAFAGACHQSAVHPHRPHDRKAELHHHGLKRGRAGPRSFQGPRGIRDPRPA